MHCIDLLHIRIFFLYTQLISKIVIFWCNVDDFTVFLLLQNSSDFEICSLMRDNDIMLNNNFFSVYKSSCMCRIPTQTYCKILLSNLYGNVHVYFLQHICCVGRSWVK